MRTLSWWLAASLALTALGCAGGNPSPVLPDNTTAVPNPVATLAATGADLGAIIATNDMIEGAMGLYTLTVDPATLTATAELRQARTAQANDDLYELSIDNFLTPASFQVTGIGSTATTLDVTYDVTHPFPAPANPAGTPNGFSNRADLSIAGRVLLLADVSAAAGNTYFTDRVANTALVDQPSGYYSPAGLLSVTATANTFPYMALVDEAGANGSRVGVPNGGVPTGNYGTDGWTRGEFGANNDGWTGYGVLHGGQTSRNTISLNLAELSTGLSLDIAIIAKYNDPRGGANAAEKRSNRLPPATPDHTRFAYRMPHGALDVESIEFLGEGGGFLPNQVSGSELRFRVVDWDARATETAAADLAADATVTNVEVGESGVPSLSVSIPGVTGDATSSIDLASVPVDDDSGFGGDAAQDSGAAGDGLFYAETVTKTVTSGQVAGDFVGMVRATDVEAGAPFALALDATTLLPLSSNLPAPIAYQAFTVTMGSACVAPSAAMITPADGCSGATATFNVSFTGDPAVTYSWNFGGGATPNTSSNASPMVSLGAAGTYNGSVEIDNGCGAPVNFPFSFDVDPGFSEHQPDAASSADGRGGYYNSMGLVNGNPAFVHAVTNGTLGAPISIRYVRALVPNPTSPADWSGYELANFPAAAAGSTDTGIGLEVIAGRPVVIFKNDTTNFLNCIASLSTNPTSIADWGLVHNIDAVTNAHLTFGTTVHNGTVAVCYRDAGVAASIRIAQAVIPIPAATANWVNYVLEDNANSLAFWSDIHSFDDGVSPRLAVAYRDSNLLDIRFARATTLIPASAADWTTPFIIDSPASTGANCAITQYNAGAGNPRLAVAANDQSVTSGVRLYLANTLAPSAPADFNASIFFPTTAAGGFSTVQYADIDIANHNGRLVLAYTAPLDTGAACASFGSMPISELHWAYATTNNPTSVADFSIETVDDENVAVGFPCGTPPVFLGTSVSILPINATEIALIARDGKNWVGLPTLASQYYTRECALP